MTKTIQVNVDDYLKDEADSLFESLGLDTSTAVRMFLIASTEAGGIPFPVAHNVDHEETLHESIAYRKAGGEFLTAEQSLANMQAAINAGANSKIEI